jgi:hypothetical protein
MVVGFDILNLYSFFIGAGSFLQVTLRVVTVFAAASQTMSLLLKKSPADNCLALCLSQAVRLAKASTIVAEGH